MSNNFINNEVPSRSVTPSLGFASSSSHLSSMQYNPHLNNFQQQQQQQIPQHNGYNSPMSPFNNLVGGNPNYNSFTNPNQQIATPLQKLNSNNNFMQQPSPLNPVISSFSSATHINAQTPPMVHQLMAGAPINQPQMGLPNLVSNWNYIDAQNEIRGPFTSMQMDSWFTSGYLNNDLRISHISCSPMNPFDDINVPLNYPYGMNSTKYVTLKEFMEYSNSTFQQNIFFNFDCLCTMIMKDFLSRGFNGGAKPFVSQQPQQIQQQPPPTPIQLQQPQQQQPIVSNMLPSNSIMSNQTNSITPSIVPQTTDISKLLDLDNLSKISSHEEISKLNHKILTESSSTKSTTTSKVSTQSSKPATLSFREALALKTPQHPNAYNHVQKKHVGVKASESRNTKTGVYDPNYYMVSDYVYRELFEYGIKDGLGNECHYLEHTAFMPVGKVVDNVIETADWPKDFYDHDNDYDTYENITFKSYNEIKSEKIKVQDPDSFEKSANYFARVHGTRLVSETNNTQDYSFLPAERVHFTLAKIVKDLFASIDSRTPIIDGTLITYLSKVYPDLLKKLLVSIRIILDSKVPFFDSVYEFIATNFTLLLPDTKLVFDKNIDILDLPFDETVFNLLRVYFINVDLHGTNFLHNVRKIMELLKFFDAKNEPYNKDSTINQVLNSSEYKKAKIDILISKIDGASSANKKKKKKNASNEAQAFKTKWDKVNFNIFTDDLPIHYYLSKGLDPRSVNASYKPIPLFNWNSLDKDFVFAKKEEIPLIIKKSSKETDTKQEITEKTFNETPVKSQTKDTNSKTKATQIPSTTLKAEVPVKLSEAEQKISALEKTKQKNLNSNINSKPNGKSKVLENKLPEPVVEKKLLFKWEKTEEPVNKGSILDIINEKKEEEKRLKEAKKLESTKIFVPPRDFIKEALLKEEQESQSKKVTSSGTPWIKDTDVVKTETIDPLRNVMNQKIKKNNKPSVSPTAIESVNAPVKKNLMPDTYTMSDDTKQKSNTPDPLAQLVDPKRKISIVKAKTPSPSPTFNDEFIKEQERLLKELELKKKQDDAQWVTIDKKQVPKGKKSIQIAKTTNAAILNPDKLRKVAAPKPTKVAVSSVLNQPTASSVGIPSSTQKEFVQWCEKNLGDADFLSILFSMDKANVSFFVDMVNSTSSNKPKINGKTATEFFKIKESFEKNRGFLSWNETLSNLNSKDDDWSFQTVKKKK